MAFAAMLAIVAALCRWSHLSRALLFWSAFVLTRPLGAVVGDYLDKPAGAGGLALARYTVSALLLGFILHRHL